MHFQKCLGISGNAGFPQFPATHTIQHIKLFKKFFPNYDDLPFPTDVVVLNSVVVLDGVVEDGLLIHLLSPEIQVSQDSSKVGQDVKIIHSKVTVSKVNHRQASVELHSWRQSSAEADGWV